MASKLNWSVGEDFETNASERCNYNGNSLLASKCSWQKWPHWQLALK